MCICMYVYVYIRVQVSYVHIIKHNNPPQQRPQGNPAGSHFHVQDTNVKMWSKATVTCGINV